MPLQFIRRCARLGCSQWRRFAITSSTDVASQARTDEREIILEVKGVSKQYGTGDNVTVALKDANFKVYRGEFVLIVGHSGSGKSTLLNMIGLIDRPTTGQVFIDSVNASLLSDSGRAELRKKKIGFIFQFFNLITDLSVIENVMLPSMMNGLSEEKGAKEAEQLLDKVGLGAQARKQANKLSGGQMQRVAVARSLINRPAIILADEPTGNLDSKTSDDVIGLMKKLNKEISQTFVIVTHDRETFGRVDRIVTIKDGMIENVESFD